MVHQRGIRTHTKREAASTDSRPGIAVALRYSTKLPLYRWPTLDVLAVKAAKALLAQPRQRMEYDEWDSLVNACTDHVMCAMYVQE